MNQLRILTQLMKADFRQRTRQFSFILTLAAAIYISFLYVPPASASYVTMSLGPIRGIYNSAWMGIMFAMVIATTLPMIVFYLVNNSINRDRHTGVGQIIAATPISKPIYLLGKWLSNVTVLALIMVVMTVMALVMQWVRGEDTAVHLLPLISPIWLMGLPVMGLVAALAVLFESIPFLSDGLGNIVYFFLWNAIMMTALPLDNAGLFRADANDLMGLSQPFSAMQQQIETILPGTLNGDFAIAAGYDHISTFAWAGYSWTLADVGRRALWLMGAIALVLAAAIPFDRFDKTRQRKQKRDGRWQQILARLGRHEQAVADPKMTTAASARLTPLPPIASHTRFTATLMAELKLALKGQPWWWYLGAAAINIIQLTSGGVDSLQIALLGLVWPVLIWSALGTREKQRNTQRIVFSAAFPLRRQLPATWLAGVLVAALMVVGAALRLLLAAEWVHLLALGVGVLFVPSMALALGTWSGANRLFEVAYLFWWYLALNGLPAFDFISAKVASPTLSLPLGYLAATALLLAMAVAGRQFSLSRDWL